jgi:5-methylcytosine-specific restriction enzyme subunit McrC
MRTLLLREYELRRGITLTLRQAKVLQDRFRCQVTLSDTSGERFDVKPHQFVGAIVDGDTTIVVSPKLSIARVLFLLAHSADPAWIDDAALAEAESLTEGAAMLFAAACDRAMRNGILRGYRDHRERLHTVRGRIDFAEQLRTNPGRDLPLTVSYQEHDEDILENRLLLAALEIVAELPIHSTATRRAITRLRRALADVTLQLFDSRRLPAVTWTRLNQNYRPAVDLARVILTGAEANLRAGAIHAPGLVINMNTVFEDFVRNALRHTLGLDEREFPSGRDAPLPLDEARRLMIEPDLSVRRDGRCHMVGEIKYRYDTGDGDTPHLYQTLAYANAAGLPDATLIYADGPPAETTHWLPNAGVRIHVRHLDLKLPRDNLLQQIRSLADHISAPITRASFGAPTGVG